MVAALIYSQIVIYFLIQRTKPTVFVHVTQGKELLNEKLCAQNVF